MYKIDKLLKQDQKLFHTADLALLWGINNKNTLYTAIKRYCQKGVLIPIHKGFYATLPLNQINPFRIAIGYLHRFCYISCETVLVKNGIIFQKGEYISLISDISKIFTIANNNYLVRKMSDKYLYNPAGIDQDNEVGMAAVERAVSDLLYFNPNYHFDNRKAINWAKVREIQKEVGYL